MRWRGFVGLRNVVTHQYFALEPEILHAILTDEIPELAETVARVGRSDLSRYDPG
ncbi:MAG: HepT-like ribonuclease domain-containing protein [Salinarimonas sp.]